MLSHFLDDTRKMQDCARSFSHANHKQFLHKTPRLIFSTKLKLLIPLVFLLFLIFFSLWNNLNFVFDPVRVEEWKATALDAVICGVTKLYDPGAQGSRVSCASNGTINGTGTNSTCIILDPAWLISLTMPRTKYGFFSIVNNALAGYLASWMEKVPCHFIITDDKHPYASAFQVFLREPFPNSTVPLYLWTSLSASSPSPNSNLGHRHANNFMLSEKTSLTRFIELELCKETKANSWRDPVLRKRSYTILDRIWQGNWDFFLKERPRRELKLGKSSYFQLKSRLARQLWLPSDEVLRTVSAMRTALQHDNGCAHFITVHLRKGDKIRLEVQDLPNSAYLSALRKIIDKNPVFYSNNCSSIPIFVMSDDDNAAKSLISELWKLGSSVIARNGSSFVGYTWLDLLRRVYHTHEAAFLRMGIRYNDAVWVHNRLGGAGYSQVERAQVSSTVEEVGGPQNLDVNLYLMHELISSVSLGALGSHLICRFSSNVPRFMALLRGELNTALSLDNVWDSQK